MRLRCGTILAAALGLAAHGAVDRSAMSEAYWKIWDAAEETRIDKDIEANRKADGAFAVPAPDGTEISLSSLRGKVVLIDFWASWCGPCLREAPNVRKVYQKYHEKGFEVLGVSLDEASKREAWLLAIDKHQLTWLQGSTLKGWQCPVAKLYNVTAIPAMFLLDREGRIVATNARGEKLEEEVAKLCE